MPKSWKVMSLKISKSLMKSILVQSWLNYQRDKKFMHSNYNLKVYLDLLNYWTRLKNRFIFISKPLIDSIIIIFKTLIYIHAYKFADYHGSTLLISLVFW